MNLKKTLTILFGLYGLITIIFLVLNSEMLWIQDVPTWTNIIITNLIFMVLFFILGLVMTHNFEQRIKRLNKTVNDLKSRLFDTIKDDEEREKMLRDFEKSLK